jgi:hypothetical protein
MRAKCLFTKKIRPPTQRFRKSKIGPKMLLMAKKTEMSSSSLWIFAIVLLALSAWMYFKR